MNCADSFTLRGKSFHIAVMYENYKGGRNNLCVAEIYNERGQKIITGTSVRGKEAANAKRNLMKSAW